MMIRTPVFTVGILSAFLLTSCNRELTLQSYLVESQTKKGFTSIDLPMSFIQPKKDEVSDEIKNVYQSIRKVNLVGFPYSNNEVTYETEKKTLKAIFKNSDSYKNLIKADLKGTKLNLYYNDDMDSIDEFIVFGYSKEVGLGVARILGEDMNPL